MRKPCGYCPEPIKPLQVASGLEWKGVVYYGHYRCTLAALGSEALGAIQAGLIPLFRDGELDADGCLPKIVKRYGGHSVKVDITHSAPGPMPAKEEPRYG